MIELIGRFIDTNVLFFENIVANASGLSVLNNTRQSITPIFKEKLMLGLELFIIEIQN